MAEAITAAVRVLTPSSVTRRRCRRGDRQASGGGGSTLRCMATPGEIVAYVGRHTAPAVVKSWTQDELTAVAEALQAGIDTIHDVGQSRGPRPVQLPG